MRTAKDKRQVVVLQSAVREAKEILTDGQYAYVVGIVKRLVDFGDRKELSDLRIAPIGEFFELKLKGHLLGRINLRVYFAYRPDCGELVVLKTYKKEEEHQVSRHVVINLEDRLDEYDSSKESADRIVYRR